eukprot:5354492-Pleurochrysis_carterae.AAC.1
MPASAPSLPASSWPTLTETGSPPATSNILMCSSSELPSVTYWATLRPPVNHTGPLPRILKALSAP